ncbi:hypothetical protein ONS96_014108 [Cadophora gregata f. sp. sojae]|nr:hypothetical protein ONS96_014108 [Cadophora gregata f. sp. sojae]
MAPSADPLLPLPVDTNHTPPSQPAVPAQEIEIEIDRNGNEFKSRNSSPLKKSGVLDAAFEFEDVTPVIGREYPKARIVEDILGAENADELIRDLAVTISERGVVFFRAQTSLTDDLQKELILRLGALTGRPPTSTVHIHPTLNNTNEFGVSDAEISTISSLHRKKSYFTPERQSLRRNTKATEASWHSDIQFEEVPADYTSLTLVELPESGGDTLWASGECCSFRFMLSCTALSSWFRWTCLDWKGLRPRLFVYLPNLSKTLLPSKCYKKAALTTLTPTGYDIYDRFSAPYQRLFDSLTATYSGEGFLKAVASGRAKLYTGARGSPLNTGGKLSAVHPLVRTNPVTGWKSVFGIGNFPKYINELDPEESEELLARLYRVIEGNHDLQCRFKWRNRNDIAIWDNRSAFHSATFDYEGLGERAGHRVVGIGEKPYFDPESKSKAQALAEEAAAKEAAVGKGREGDVAA